MLSATRRERKAMVIIANEWQNEFLSHDTCIELLIEIATVFLNYFQSLHPPEM